MQQDGSGAGASPPRRFRTLGVALVAGVAGGLIAPLLYPSVSRNARPAARKAMKAGIAAFERGRELAAEWGEQAGDLLAEARAEYDAGARGEHQPAAAEPGGPGATEVVSLRGVGRDGTGS
jgi:hypothetical protein